MLPFLVWEAGVNIDGFDENIQRSLIEQSLVLHKCKGTVWAIEQVFEALNMKADVKEWFSYGGEPYHF